MKKLQQSRGFTVVELLCAAAISLVVIAGATSGVIALQKSFDGTQQYASGMNDGSRLIDYISRDLRNAVKVTKVVGGVPTAFKSGSIDVEGTDQLSISVPDYYMSNTRLNASGSAYKTPRYSRANLAAGSSYYPYDTVVGVTGTIRVPKYPALLEIRYIKKARSVQDPTMCYFRREYEGGAAMTLRSDVDIAQNVTNEKLTVTAVDLKRFRLFTTFRPKWSGETRRAATQQIATVKVLNTRQD
jgi:prepilin-type N-terminal cleavage/methylation domain-containing protein